MSTHEMPYDGRDDESGKFTPEFADEDFIDAVRAADAGATTNEVGEAVGCKYRTAKKRLDRLEDEGRVSSRRIGNALLWNVADE